MYSLETIFYMVSWYLSANNRASSSEAFAEWLERNINLKLTGENKKYLDGFYDSWLKIKISGRDDSAERLILLYSNISEFLFHLQEKNVPVPRPVVGIAAIDPSEMDLHSHFYSKDSHRVILLSRYQRTAANIIWCKSCIPNIRLGYYVMTDSGMRGTVFFCEETCPLGEPTDYVSFVIEDYSAIIDKFKCIDNMELNVLATLYNSKLFSKSPFEEIDNLVAQVFGKKKQK